MSSKWDDVGRLHRNGSAQVFQASRQDAFLRLYKVIQLGGEPVADT